MDPAACFAILRERREHDDGNSSRIEMNAISARREELDREEAEASSSSSSSDPLSVSSGDPSVSDYKAMSNLDLINLFTAVQGERVRAYRRFDDELHALLYDGEEGDRLVEYPTLCTKMTTHFSTLSQQVISVKEEFTTRGDIGKEMVSLIKIIQELEKERLMIAAAKHLEMIQEKFPLFQTQAGFHAQPEFTKRRICEVQALIVEQMEAVQAEKCEFI